MSQTFDKKNYEGAKPSTLCLGCGHDQISKSIIKTCFELQLDPTKIAKISGIGCSSKTPNYFLKMSQGFNTIHGRMSSVATGVKIANSDLKVIGISGDGDTGSIGLGSFLHTIRRNTPMIYIVENNGVYGLTKGQFSATAKKDSSIKNRDNNPFINMDLCRLALETGCGFVARSFSGDGKQLVNLLKLAFKYDGFAFIDVISPCIAYGNNVDFPYSFSSVKENNLRLHELDIIEEKASVNVDFKEGEVQSLSLVDGSTLYLKKVSRKEHDPRDLKKASELLKNDSDNKELITGLIYYKETTSFLEQIKILKKPLISLEEKDIRPRPSDLKNTMNSFT